MRDIEITIHENKKCEVVVPQPLVEGENRTTQIVVTTPAAWTDFTVMCLLTTPAGVLVDAVPLPCELLSSMLDAPGTLQAEFIAYRGDTDVEVDRTKNAALMPVSAARNPLGEIPPEPLPNLLAQMETARTGALGAATAANEAAASAAEIDAQARAAEAIRVAQETARAAKAIQDAAEEQARASAEALRQSTFSAISASPKGTYATTAALSAAFPTGNANIYVVTADGGWYYWSGSAWTKGGTYQATGIASNSVAETQLQSAAVDYLRHYKSGQYPLLLKTNPKNLFDKSTITAGKYVSWSTGALGDSAYFVVSDYIPVYPGQVLFVNNANQLAFYNEAKTYVGGINSPTTFTVPNNAYFLRFCVSVAYSIDLIQMEKGSSATSYESYHTTKKHDVTDYFTSESMIEGITGRIFEAGVVSKNLYNPTVGTDGYYVVAGSGALAANASYTASDYIAVSPSTVYARTYIDQIAFYNAGKVYISGTNKSSGLTTFTTPATAAFVRVCFPLTEKATYQVEEGSATTEYHPYNGRYVTRDQLYTDAQPLQTIKGVTSQVVLSATQKKIKLIGDSITHGVGGTGFAQDGDIIMTWYASTFRVNTNGHCWANSLKAFLEARHNCVVYNYGCTGANSGMLVDGLSQLIDGDEDIVICMIGTNDRSNNTQQQFYDNLGIIKNYCENLGIKFILMSNIPASIANETGTGINYHMEDVDAVIMKSATDHNAEYVSVYKLFTDYCLNTGATIDSLLSDGLHPNDEGYDVMFKLIANALGFGIKRPEATW